MYNNIMLFCHAVNIDATVTIDPSGPSIAGESSSLTYSATVTPNPLSGHNHEFLPTFEWFFGSNNDSLPSGLTPMATTLGSAPGTFTTTLQFSPLSQSYAGMYTCRLGGRARLAATAMIFVNRTYVVSSSVFIST